MWKLFKEAIDRTPRDNVEALRRLHDLNTADDDLVRLMEEVAGELYPPVSGAGRDDTGYSKSPTAPQPRRYASLGRLPWLRTSRGGC